MERHPSSVYLDVGAIGILNAVYGPFEAEERGLDASSLAEGGFLDVLFNQVNPIAFFGEIFDVLPYPEGFSCREEEEGEEKESPDDGEDISEPAEDLPSGKVIQAEEKNQESKAKEKEAAEGKKDDERLTESFDSEEVQSWLFLHIDLP